MFGGSRSLWGSPRPARAFSYTHQAEGRLWYVSPAWASQSPPWVIWQSPPRPQGSGSIPGSPQVSCALATPVSPFLARRISTPRHPPSTHLRGSCYRHIVLMKKGNKLQDICPGRPAGWRCFYFSPAGNLKMRQVLSQVSWLAPSCCGVGHSSPTFSHHGQKGQERQVSENWFR